MKNIAHITIQDVVKKGQYLGLFVKHTPTWAYPLITNEDVHYIRELREQFQNGEFIDLEGRVHQLVRGRVLFKGVKDEFWMGGLEKFNKERELLSDALPDPEGFRQYRMKNPVPLHCYLLEFPFRLNDGRTIWEIAAPQGAIVTWDGWYGSALDVRVIQRDIFDKTYKHYE
ncbi:hypothetical protein EPA93_19130 [Ktedonosporobacter rubrisoli]|uniref:Uncharacterized protein n=1 Tax=Ktedonosporobacter rubrisoli TaxID=2509675 RepID=A0A4P6JRQ1_KTERU|nr:hypothetical protein [Ktedonosporobacter rubrisoli]QBD77993.1 hypothetical protein EPA93_19130 [Ktedonosporobacter rubrisoli]